MAHPAPGGFVHLDFASNDPRRTRQFFEEVFQWRFESRPGHEDAPHSGLFPEGGAVLPPSEALPHGALNYILSENIEEDIDRVIAGGAKILIPRREIPRVGSWALIKEPGGSAAALFQARRPDR
jgi:uncharacterized protein